MLKKLFQLAAISIRGGFPCVMEFVMLKEKTKR